jgi:methionyl-tRNA formyltransferase
VRGHAETGITLMQMTAGMDEGPILLQRPLPIEPDDTVSGLTQRLSELGAEALLETLALWNELEPREQDHDRATYAPRVDREAARIDWTRAPPPSPTRCGGWTPCRGRGPSSEGAPLKLFRPEVTPRPAGQEDAAPGAWSGRPVVFATGDGGAVAFHEVQPAGKRRMAAEDWARGALD